MTEINKGINLGKIQTLSKQLQIKFKKEADSYISMLDQLQIKELDSLQQRILTCSSIEEVFEGISKAS